MNRPWLDNYPAGVPQTIDPDSYPSAWAMVEQSFQRYSDRPAFINHDTTFDYAELDAKSRDLAAWMQTKLALKKGDRVALMMPNILQYPVALFAVMRAGAVIVNVNPMYTPRELEHQLNDSGATAIVIVDQALPVLNQVIANTGVRHAIVTSVDELLDGANAKVDLGESAHGDWTRFNDALRAGGEAPFASVELTGDDTLFLQYTGGTTGVSKGAELTHRNLVANTLQIASYFGGGLEEAKEVFFTALPLYHIFGLTVNTFVPVRHGGISVLITDPADPAVLSGAFRQHAFTFVSAVNTLYNGITHIPGMEKIDFKLKYCVGGGAAVQSAVAKRWKNLTGCPILEGYGLSETSPVLTLNPTDIDDHTGTIGLPLPSTDISIRDSAGKELPLGEEGELCAKGPQVMRGYWNRDAATRESMTDDGFFRTGDMATMDERGFFRIIDRKKDMILVSGFNVYPNEVEAVVAEFDGVFEVACIGVPDDKSGETVKVFVVAEPGATVDTADLKQHCRANLAAYKVPKHYELIEELPKSTVGKILRRELRDR